ncbi:dephospho-CoA kinase [Sphingomonas sp. F9_3S_D5_B_2]
MSDGLQLIELFGLPGCGKSLVAERICSLHDIRSRSDLSTSWQELRRIEKARHLAASFADISSDAAIAQLVGGERIATKRPLKRTARLLAKSAWLRAQRGRLLLDQGFLQDLWSILYSADRMAPDAGRIARVISRLYLGTDTHVVFIDVPRRCSAERVAQRTHGDSRLDGLGQTEILARLDRSARIPDAIIEAAGRAGLTVHRVDGTQPFDAVVEQVGTIAQRSAKPRTMSPLSSPAQAAA